MAARADVPRAPIRSGLGAIRGLTFLRGQSKSSSETTGGGKSWRRQPLEVDTYFASYAQCVAAPFGIYDVAQNFGYVTVGISHNTAEFAVNCLVNWWKLHGRSVYPHADRVLILADGGGGNGYNLRTWKKDLQDRLCDALGLTVSLSHHPHPRSAVARSCSKPQPIEYLPGALAGALMRPALAPKTCKLASLLGRPPQSQRGL